eukprot:1185930-Prorocentrum_minimum.AAC.3
MHRQPRRIQSARQGQLSQPQHARCRVRWLASRDQVTARRARARKCLLHAVYIFAAIRHCACYLTMKRPFYRRPYAWLVYRISGNIIRSGRGDTIA